MYIIGLVRIRIVGGYFPCHLFRGWAKKGHRSVYVIHYQPRAMYEIYYLSRFHRSRGDMGNEIKHQDHVETRTIL